MHELAGELTLVNSASRLSREAVTDRPEAGDSSELVVKTLATGIEADDIDRHPVLGMLPEPVKRDVAARARRIRVARGEPLFHQGDPARRIYQCVSGELKLFRLSGDGEEKIVNLIHAGRSFAEATMFMPRRVYPVHCSALKASELIGYDADRLAETLRASPELCFAMLGMLSRRLHEKIGLIETLSLANARMRVAGYLVDEARASAGHDRLELAVGKKYVANLLGLKPETFSRVIGALAEDGLLTTSARKFKLHDVERLERIARGL